jgi:deaminated glutathione amidase
MMAGSLTVACVQVNAGPEIEPNLHAVGDLILRAREAGADFITTPENVSMVVQGRARVLERARPENDHPAIPFFQDLARRTGAWLLAGSLAVRLDGEDRAANRSLLFSPDGAIAARYDKIHMFDVDLENGESWRESAAYHPGHIARIADLPFGKLGFSICYDARFPELFRQQAVAGAEIMTVPAAFTRQTGEAHWEILLRARAIENGLFVIAAAQAGTHEDGRQTFGHSMIIDPWGRVLAEAAPTGEEIIVAEIDVAAVHAAREKIPNLRNARSFVLDEVVPAGKGGAAA